MNGRIENENKIFTKVENMLVDLPLYVKEWYLSLRASNCTGTTCQGYIGVVREFLRMIDINTKNISITEITRSNANTFMILKQTIKKGGDVVESSITTRQRAWSAMNNFMSFLYAERYIPENYMANIRKPVNRRIVKRKKFLDEDCLKHILFYSKNYIDIEKKTRNYAVIRLFITTGMRKTALTSINIEDLDFRNRELHVIDKRDKELVYYLDNEMIKALKEWISVRETIKGNDNALFLSLYGNGRGKRMSKDSVDILVKNVCKNAGYHDVTPHQLRASFCSIMYEKTKDIEFVRRSVGHADVATTMRYITTNNDERQKSVNIMSNILEG